MRIILLKISKIIGIKISTRIIIAKKEYFHDLSQLEQIYLSSISKKSFFDFRNATDTSVFITVRDKSHVSYQVSK